MHSLLMRTSICGIALLGVLCLWPRTACGVDVHTRYGWLRGVRRNVGSSSAEPYVDAFLNIPYAQPPVGDLRFKNPQPPQRWTGIRDATVPGAKCPQLDNPDALIPPSRRFPISEDCLYLNVYRPQVSNEDRFSVMLWIHGGSYSVGSGHEYDGTQLAAKGVVVVTINYRLSAFGFLSSESDVSVGNYGLQDMIRALIWVRDVISAFNGDPEKVTIFGESSGSTAVSLLILSPATVGLFSKAIMQSGVSLTPWATAHSGIWPRPAERLQQLARLTRCDVSRDVSSCLQCLRSRPFRDIVNASAYMEYEAQSMQFVPVIEATFGQAGLFPATALVRLQDGHLGNVTTIRGWNVYESGVRDPDDDGMTLTEFQSMLRNLVTREISRYSSLPADVIEARLLDAYVTRPNLTDPFSIRRAALEFGTDYRFAAPTIRELELTTRAISNPQHLYRFTYRSSYRLTPVWQGAQHGDELHYVFGAPFNNDAMWNGFVSNWTDDDRKVADRLMTLWANFAKTGQPETSTSGIESWMPWTVTSPNYLEIGVTDVAESSHKAAQISTLNQVMDVDMKAVQDHLIG